ncbi:MAG: amino acid ABC transporter permease [Proteobacteria bacterium]|nr:amino acid ABC transporter permease [Pseudomonadota bacterium]
MPAAPSPAAALAERRARARAALPPPVERVGALRWMRDNLFSSLANTLLTLLTVAALALVVPPILMWAFVGSVWYPPDPEVCRAATGACWAVIVEKHRVMFFGLYPYAEHWRPFLAVILYVVAVALTCWRRCWSWQVLVPLWAASLAAIVVLMLGGIFGLTVIDTGQWGGVPLTMVVFTATVTLGLPLGVVLALGRRSEMPVIRLLSVLFIEFIRAVPLVTILFCAAVVFPLFLPPGWNVDKMVRVLIGMGIFYGCYFAEVIRGGLQAIPRGQYEAAASLGLSYWRTTRKIILPQALRIVIPGLMNHIISAFKNSTLVIIVGLFDLLNATGAAVADPLWIRYYTEGYLFVAAVYFVGAFALSKYSQQLERWLAEGRRY